MTLPAEVEGSRTPTVGERVRAYLEEHPDLAHSPGQVAKDLGVSVGSARRECATWVSRQKANLLGPVLLQNIRFFGRTTPGTTYPGSPPPGWIDRGDNKLTFSAPLPPDGRLDVCWSPNGSVEVTGAAPRGLTPSEVMHVFAIARSLVPIDSDFGGSLSYETLQDGGSLRIEGVESVNLHTLDGIILKAYNHTDRRGEAFRREVRVPPAKVSLREVEAMFDRRPMGRDSALERLTLQVEDLARAHTWTRKEILHMRKALDEMRGGSG